MVYVIYVVIFPLLKTPTIPHPVYCSGFFFPETNTWKTYKFPHLVSQPGPVSPALQKSPQQRMERSTKDRAAGNPCMFQVNDPCKNANCPHIFRNILQPDMISCAAIPGDPGGSSHVAS